MVKSTPVYAWHFLPEDRHLSNGDGRLVTPGKRLSIRGDIVLCKHGLHASKRPLDALKYAPSAIVQRVRMHGTIVHDTDKLVASSRTCMWIADASAVLHEFACLCAEDALRLIPNPDPRAVKAIAVKRAWLRGKATDEELTAAMAAARDGAMDAARAAAGAAAMDAARAAAGAAAWDAAGAAAWDAAWDAAGAAAGAAARAAARDAARDAAGAAQSSRLHTMLMALAPEGYSE